TVMPTPSASVTDHRSASAPNVFVCIAVVSPFRKVKYPQSSLTRRRNSTTEMQRAEKDAGQRRFSAMDGRFGGRRLALELPSVGPMQQSRQVCEPLGERLAAPAAHAQ